MIGLWKAICLPLQMQRRLMMALLAVSKMCEMLVNLESSTQCKNNCNGKAKKNTRKDGNRHKRGRKK